MLSLRSSGCFVAPQAGNEALCPPDKLPCYLECQIWTTMHSGAAGHDQTAAFGLDSSSPQKPLSVSRLQASDFMNIFNTRALYFTLFRLFKAIAPPVRS